MRVVIARKDNRLKRSYLEIDPNTSLSGFADVPLAAGLPRPMVFILGIEYYFV